MPADARSGDGFDRLKEAIGDSDRIRAFYLAVAPATLRRYRRPDPRARAGHRRRPAIVVEKPIGRDLPRRRRSTTTIGKVFDEEQIFRIDHYLGKETVQNLMALRFANALFEPLWNSAHIDHVQITVAETVGLEGRAGYYDKAGALRDMVQNHMLQLLCLVAMEPPSSMDADAVRDEKLKVLRCAEARSTATRRPSSRCAANIAPAPRPTGRSRAISRSSASGQRDTETFVAIKAEIANWRWAGRALLPAHRQAAGGAGLGNRHRVQADSAFDLRRQCRAIIANQLVIRLQPDEGVKQWIMIKDPGPGGMRLRQIPLDMSFAQSFDERNAGCL